MKQFMRATFILLAVILGGKIISAEKRCSSCYQKHSNKFHLKNTNVCNKNECISTFLKQHAVCDYKGNWHLFKNKKGEPYNFNFTKPEGTRIANIEEQTDRSKPILNEYCASCFGEIEGNDKTGKEILTEVYEALQKKFKKEKNSETVYSMLAESLYNTFYGKRRSITLYGEVISGETKIEKAKDRFFEKYKQIRKKIDTTAESEKQARHVLFDDLCAVGLIYQIEPGLGPQARPANLDNLWENFETKKFCNNCLEKNKNKIGLGEGKQPLWNIKRPAQLGAPHLGGVSGAIFTILGAFSLTSLNIGDFASQDHSYFFEAYSQSQYPARVMELDSRWAEHYKMQHPDPDPALTYGFSKKDYFGTRAKTLTEKAYTPVKFLKNNILPILIGITTTAFTTDEYNKNKHTVSSLKKGLFESNKGWAAGLDLFILGTNLITPTGNFVQTRKNYSHSDNAAESIGRLLLGRGLAPTVLAQSLGASSGSLTALNFASNLLFPQNKIGLLFGQSLGLALKGHKLPALASLALPVVFGNWIEPSQKFENLSAMGGGMGLPLPF